MKHLVSKIIFITISLAFLQCQTHNDSPNPYKLLDSISKKHATQKKWNSISAINYNKHLLLLEKSGDTLINRDETHTYSFNPSTKRTINYTLKGNHFTLSQVDNTFTYTKNNTLDSSQKSKAANSINAASFVLGLPHTLNTKEVTLKYLKTKTVENTLCHTIGAQFNNSNDYWQLFFDTENLNWIGYWVKTTDHYSLVINNELQKIEGFTLPRKRNSYRTDSLMNKTWLRASYQYTGFEID